MKGLEAITKNPLIVNAFSKTVKKMMKENGITLLTIEVDDKGEFKFTPYTEKMKVISETDLSQLLTTINL